MSWLIPAYFHPAVAGDDWARLLGADLTGSVVVVNVADGPGSHPQPDLVDPFSRLMTRGAVVAGYVDLDYGRRSGWRVRHDATAWRDLYGIQNVFGDQLPSCPEDLVRMGSLMDSLRSDGTGMTVLNPGCPPAEGYRDVCDVLVTFEGSWASYRRRSYPSPDAPGHADTCHLVHHVPGDRTHEVAELARARGARFSYASVLGGDNPWHGLSPECG